MKTALLAPLNPMSRTHRAGVVGGANGLPMKVPVPILISTLCSIWAAERGSTPWSVPPRDTLFVGIDVDGVCVVRCAERAIAQGVTNAVFVFNEEDRDLSDFFAEGELSAVLLNFPTPFPKKKKAPLRLTYLDRLMAYRPLLAKGAPLRLRTDSMPMHEFSLTQLELAGYELLWNTDDVRSLFPEEPWSGYEQKLVAQGASVYGFAAVAGPEPEAVQQTAPLSLVSYLPDDLENMAYVPHGMQGCVRNMRGRNRNRRARGLPEWKKPIV